jgi:two-component system, chemotaxis family, protein-glutamate methylesterase/glutaminase
MANVLLALFSPASWMTGPLVFGILNATAESRLCKTPKTRPSPPCRSVLYGKLEADYTAPLADIGPLLTGLVMKQTEETKQPEEVTGVENGPRLTEYTCPDCRGTIWEVKRGTNVEYRCRIGHAYSPRTMLSEHFMAQEKALWAAVVALEEGAVLAGKMADHWPDLRERLREESRQRREQAAALRQLLNERTTFSID